MYYSKIKMESEYYLHIRTAAGEPAAHLSLRPDHGGGTHGLWQNYGSELVSGAARQSRSVKCHPHQCIFR